MSNEILNETSLRSFVTELLANNHMNESNYDEVKARHFLGAVFLEFTQTVLHKSDLSIVLDGYSIILEEFQILTESFSAKKFIDLNPSLILCQVFWVLDHFLTASEPIHDNLITIALELSHYQEPPLLLSEHLMQVMEPSFLVKMGIISSVVDFNRKATRIGTSLFYKQIRYNLFAENTTGWSLLLWSLCFGNDVDIASIIGTFDLDPNRVISVLYSLMANQFNFDTYLEKTLESNMNNNLVNLEQYLVSLSYSKSHLVSLFGFQLQSLKSSDDSMLVDSYCALAARFVMKQTFSIEELLPYFGITSLDLLFEGSPNEFLSIFLSFLLSMGYPVNGFIVKCCRKQPDMLIYRDHAMSKQILRRIDVTLNSKKEILFLLSLLPKKSDLHLNPFLIACLLEKIKIDGIASWRSFFLTYIFPTLQVGLANPYLNIVLGDILLELPFKTRFKLYEDWASSSEDGGEAVTEAKKILRRLSKDNYRQLGRSLAKNIHRSPLKIFAVILEQVQAYENLIGPIIDSLKYITLFGFDILIFSIINVLKMPKERLKPDGTSLSQWLQNLSVFVGSLAKKYYHSLDLVPFLEYLVGELVDSRSVDKLDLVILSDLLQMMGGIETIEELTTEQLQSLAGSELLRMETMNPSASYSIVSGAPAVNAFTPIKAPRSQKRTLTSVSLYSTLGSCGKRVILLLLLAQQVQRFLYFPPQDHEGWNVYGIMQGNIKLVSQVFDKFMSMLLQYVEFLYSHTNSIEDLPSISELVNEYQLDPILAYTLSRSYACDVNTLLTPSYDCLFMNSQLFHLLNSLSLYDIYVPIDHYQKELARIEQFTTLLTTAIQSPIASFSLTTSELLKRKVELEKMKLLFSNLSADVEHQKSHVAIVHRVLNSISFWDSVSISSLCLHFIYPRAKLGFGEALFTFKILELLFESNTSLNLLKIYDRIISDLFVLIPSFSYNESCSFGLFLQHILKQLDTWHKSEAIYYELALQADLQTQTCKRPGFLETQDLANDGLYPLSSAMTFEKFRTSLYKWHTKLFLMFVAWLDEPPSTLDYMRTRNAFCILTKLVDVFPHVTKLASKLQKSLELRLESETERPDLKMLGKRYLGLLSQKASLWIPETDFHSKGTFTASHSPVPKRSLENSDPCPGEELAFEESPKRFKLNGKIVNDFLIVDKPPEINSQEKSAEHHSKNKSIEKLSKSKIAENSSKSDRYYRNDEKSRLDKDRYTDRRDRRERSDIDRKSDHYRDRRYR